VSSDREAEYTVSLSAKGAGKRAPADCAASFLFFVRLHAQRGSKKYQNHETKGRSIKAGIPKMLKPGLDRLDFPVGLRSLFFGTISRRE
jgi:hypothetical protein